MTKGTRSSDPDSTGSRSLSNTSAARITQVWLLSGVNDDVALDVTRGGKPARSAKSYQIGDTAKTLKTRATHHVLQSWVWPALCVKHLYFSVSGEAENDASVFKMLPACIIILYPVSNSTGPESHSSLSLTLKKYIYLFSACVCPLQHACGGQRQLG